MALTKFNFYYSYYRNKIVEVLSNPKLVFFYFGRLLQYRQSSNFDILLVSYPKSGRTWLQNLMKEIGDIQFDDENKISSDTPISEALTILGKYENSFPRILATHAKSSWEQIEGLLDKNQIKEDDFKEFGNSKIVFLYRDPRDVLVSQYYHIKLRNKVDEIEKEDLISNDIIGVEKIVNFMNKWLSYADKYPNQIFTLSYEDMKKDTLKSLLALNNFIDMNANEKSIVKAIELSDIKKMQKKQASKTNKDPWTQTKDHNNINSFQSRKGIVGEHADFFNANQLKRINVLIKNLNERFGY